MAGARRPLQAAFLAILLSSAFPKTQAQSCSQDAGATVRIETMRGGSIVLADGRGVELAGIDIDRHPLDIDLGEAILSKEPSLSRHGKLRADLRINGVWASEKLVRLGQARVRPRPGDKSCFSQLLAAEDEARRFKLGLWNDPNYAVLDAAKPEDFAAHLNRFVIAQGRVLHVGQTKNWIWIDFGRIWRTDVTVAVPAREKARFSAAGLAPESLEGSILRVRGVVTFRDGPRFEVTEPAALERIAMQGEK